MSDNRDKLIEKLHALSLSKDEASVYLGLLQGPTTHLRLSRDTGIARTKVYRIVDELEKRSLAAHRTDDRGTFVVAANPENLEIEVVRREEQAKLQRDTFQQLMPALAAWQHDDEAAFIVRTYEGERGFRQMLWHDLKAKPGTEILAFGGTAIENFVSDRAWVERYRALSAEAGHRVRDIINVEVDMLTFSEVNDYMELYACRALPREVLPFDSQVAIYENTVSVYHHRDKKKVGVEIINKSYAEMMRAMFWHYWQQAKPVGAYKDYV